MNELETQVVKIQLGDNKQSSSFVYTLAETVDTSGTEIYVICELPMFNPAAADECQRISQAITASLKRSYQKKATSETFENALALINEELSKLVTIGKTHWLGKLNAIIAVKRNNILSVSSVGKISALLYRGGNFVSVTEPGSSNQPLRTFEHFSEGKLRLGDMFILSTSQLFNHLSIDRIQKILDKNDLPTAAQEIIEILQDDMGPEVACGTIFASQVEAGSTDDEEVDLSDLLSDEEDTMAAAAPATGKGLKHRVKKLASTGGTIAKNFASDFKEKYVRKSYWQGVVKKSDKSIGVVSGTLKKATEKIQPQNLGNYSRQKKFFFIAAIILLVVLVANIVIARISNRNEQLEMQQSETIQSVEKLLNDANAALIFGDEAQAGKLYAEAKNILDNLPVEFSGDSASRLDNLRQQADELSNKLDKKEQADVESLGTLSTAEHLINLPDYVATESGRTIVSYNKDNGSISDNALSTSESIVDSVALQSANRAVIFNNSELFIWNTETGILVGAYDTDVPSGNDFGGMATYSVNNKVYVVDRGDGVIRSFATSNSGFSNPQTSVEDSVIRNASDLAIDGDIYVTSGGTIYKFNAGDKQDFPTSLTSLSDDTQLYTELNFTYLYVLDPGSNQIIVLNKDGSIFKNLNSDKFTNLKDFAIDETNRTIYVLNGNELLEVKF